MGKKEIKQSELFKKIENFVHQLGRQSLYSILLLFYTYQEKDTPTWAKNIVVGALTYFIVPLDSVPDILPIGLADDFGILSFALVTISSYINMDVKIKARKKMKQWFKEIHLEELKEVEDRMGGDT